MFKYLRPPRLHVVACYSSFSKQSDRIKLFFVPFPLLSPQNHAMSVRSASSLPRVARLRTAACTRRWPPSLSSAGSARAFSTTLHRDATWGFVGLGQMGMYM
jgi:hypothetical protein